MKTLRTVVAAVAVFLSGAYLSQALQPASQKTENQPERQYRVTPWPAVGGAPRPYHQYVEDYINSMAAQGWTFKTVMVGQREKMIVFERRRG